MGYVTQSTQSPLEATVAATDGKRRGVVTLPLPRCRHTWRGFGPSPTDTCSLGFKIGKLGDQLIKAHVINLGKQLWSIKKRRWGKLHLWWSNIFRALWSAHFYIVPETQGTLQLELENCSIEGFLFTNILPYYCPGSYYRQGPREKPHGWDQNISAQSRGSENPNPDPQMVRLLGNRKSAMGLSVEAVCSHIPFSKKVI